MGNDPRAFPGSPASPTLPTTLSLSSAEIARTFVVVETDVVEGSRVPAVLLIPPLQLRHSGPLPVGRKHHGTQSRSQRRGRDPG